MYIVYSMQTGYNRSVSGPGRRRTPDGPVERSARDGSFGRNHPGIAIPGPTRVMEEKR